MLSNKPEITHLPIYFMFKEAKTILSANVRQEVLESLTTYDIALRRLNKQFEERDMQDKGLGLLVKNAVDSVAELEFFTGAIYDEIHNLKDYCERLKEQNTELRERNYQLKLENQQFLL